MEDKTNELTQHKESELTVANMMINRQAQEVQAAMVVAKKFPRDEAKSFTKIMKSCQRKGLAEQAEYTYPRGGTKVNGPSIRLAEVIAQGWGNLDYGIIELGQKAGSSEMMAYAWDLETNARVTKIFTVKHIRNTRNGNYALKDERDIYELTANFGARRVRACILSVVPGDLIDDAVQECRNTLKGSYTKPLADRVKEIVAIFETEHMINTDQIEGYLGYAIKSMSENDYVRLQGVYRSLRDKMSGKEDFFKVTPASVDPFDKEKPKAETQEPAQEALSETLRKSEPDAEPVEQPRVTPLTVRADIEAMLKEHNLGPTMIFKWAISHSKKPLASLTVEEMISLKEHIAVELGAI